MAQETTLSAMLQYADANGVKQTLSVPSFVTDANTLVVDAGVQSIGITETTLELGSVTLFGWLMLINLNPTNYVEILTETSGFAFGRLPAGGGFALFKAGSDLVAPVLLADTAPCLVQRLIISF